MKKYTINMRSAADTVEGHGVLSAYNEMVDLVKGLDGFQVLENSHKGADITHYHTVNPSYFMGIPFAKIRGKAVGYVHFLPETVDESLKLPKIARKFFYWYLILFYKSMDRLVTVNPCFIDKLAAYDIPRDKISYIPNYVSSDEFYPIDPAEKAALREKYGLDPQKFTVVCAGQLQTRKGVMDFVDLARRLPQMQFLWAGGFSFGAMTDGYAEISEMLKNPPANAKFPGIVHREEMNGIYNLGDVMFLPSYGELFPMTILEAMCCNTPVLLRDLDIYPQILFDFYQKADSQQGFEKELLRLAGDPEHYAKAKADAVRGNAFYNADHVRAMWDEFYSDLVAAPVTARDLMAKPAEKELPTATKRPAVAKLK